MSLRTLLFVIDYLQSTAWGVDKPVDNMFVDGRLIPTVLAKTSEMPKNVWSTRRDRRPMLYAPFGKIFIFGCLLGDIFRECIPEDFFTYGNIKTLSYCVYIIYFIAELYTK